jgi:hypothetical protein
MEIFFFHQLFIAGLRDKLKSKIMEAGKASLPESLSLARELKIISNDQKESSIIASIPDEQEMGDNDLEAINTICFQRGQKPFIRSNFQGGSSYPRAPTSQGHIGTSSTGHFGDKKC